MYQQLFTRLALTGAVSEYSQPVSMQGANAFQVDCVVVSLSGTSPTVTCQVQESNDLENWKDKGTPSPANIAAVGFTLFTAVTGVSSGYVRLKVTLAGTTPICVLSAGLNNSAL